jgi:hypothetical protein
LAIKLIIDGGIKMITIIDGVIVSGSPEEINKLIMISKSKTKQKENELNKYKKEYDKNVLDEHWVTTLFFPRNVLKYIMKE